MSDNKKLIKVIIGFEDLKAKTGRIAGEVIETTTARADEIIKAGYAEEIKVTIDEAEKEEKPPKKK